MVQENNPEIQSLEFRICTKKEALQKGTDT
jgi:hypothetical protein